MPRPVVTLSWRARAVLPVAVMLLVAAPAPAWASIFGEETAALAGILKQSISTVAEAVKTVQQLRESVQQLRTITQQGQTLLHTANPSSLEGLRNLVASATSTQRAIDAQIQQLGFSLKRVSTDVGKFYDVQPTSPSKTHDQALRWNQSLLESSRAAMVAQTDVDLLTERAKAHDALLEQSGSEPGVVGQLQLAVRSLMLLHQDLESVQRMLATGLRVTASMGAQQAATNDLVEKNNQLSMEGYTDPGPAGDNNHSLEWVSQ